MPILHGSLFYVSKLKDLDSIIYLNSTKHTCTMLIHVHGYVWSILTATSPYCLDVH